MPCLRALSLRVCLVQRLQYFAVDLFGQTQTEEEAAASQSTAPFPMAFVRLDKSIQPMVAPRPARLAMSEPVRSLVPEVPVELVRQQTPMQQRFDTLLPPPAANAPASTAAVPPSQARGARARLARTGLSRPVVHPRGRRAQFSCSEVSGQASSAEPPSALLQQLAKCSASSDALIQSMRKTITSRFDRSEVLLRLNTRYLLVGTCDSRFVGVAHFLPSKVVYAFEHPLHRQVEMHMAYADMLGVRLQPPSSGGARAAAAGNAIGGTSGGGSSNRAADLELRFRIGRELSYFTREYDCTNAAHELRIGFSSAGDLDQFRKLVLPNVLMLAQAETS